MSVRKTSIKGPNAAFTDINSHAQHSTNNKLTLEKVIGLTCTHNSSLAINHPTGEVAYSAGCIVVLYNPRRNKQTRFFRASKTISCLSFSMDGQFLAVGERGHQPAINIWEVSTGTLKAELKGHKFGVSCISFSKNNQLLVSIGFRYDRFLYLWKWNLPHQHQKQTENQVSNLLIAVSKVSQKIYSVEFSQDGKFFVTCGEKHVKFWYLDSNGDAIITGEKLNGLPVLESRAAIMPAHKDSCFLDIACGYGNCQGTVFGITSQGILCAFSSSRLMERWVSLDASAAYAVSVTEQYIVVGCSSGIVRMFDPVSLEYITTLPLPPALGNGNLLPDLNVDTQSIAIFYYPAAVCVRITGSKVVVVYSDHSLIVWDVKDPDKVGMQRSFLHHSAGIWDIQVLPDEYSDQEYPDDSLKIPRGSFVTCSADNTIRFWNLDLHKSKSNKGEIELKNWKNPFGKDLLKILYLDEKMSFKPPEQDHSQEQQREQEAIHVLGGSCFVCSLPDTEIPSKPDSHVGLRSLAIHPNRRDVACGDKKGNLRIYQVPSLNLLKKQAAHDAEILCLSYSCLYPPLLASDNKNPRSISVEQVNNYLASGSRDRLVHIFNVNQGYELQKTLDDHSGAITAIKFSKDGKKLLSCGGDKTIVMSNVNVNGEISRYKSIAVPYGTIYDMDIGPNNKYLVTAGQDKRLNIWSLVTGKHKRSYKSKGDDSLTGELYKVVLDPAGAFAATCSFDKWIRLFDFYSGECIAKVTGHSELVTGIKFTSDCRRLISIGGDGCIFIWRLASDLTRSMKERIAEIRLHRSVEKEGKIENEQSKANKIDDKDGVLQCLQSLAALEEDPPEPPPYFVVKKDSKEERKELYSILDSTLKSNRQVKEVTFKDDNDTSRKTSNTISLMPPPPPTSTPISAPSTSAASYKRNDQDDSIEWEEQEEPEEPDESILYYPRNQSTLTRRHSFDVTLEKEQKEPSAYSSCSNDELSENESKEDLDLIKLYEDSLARNILKNEIETEDIITPNSTKQDNLRDSLTSSFHQGKEQSRINVLPETKSSQSKKTLAQVRDSHIKQKRQQNTDDILSNMNLALHRFGILKTKNEISNKKHIDFNVSKEDKELHRENRKYHQDSMSIDMEKVSGLDMPRNEVIEKDKVKQLPISAFEGLQSYRQSDINLEPCPLKEEMDSFSFIDSSKQYTDTKVMQVNPEIESAIAIGNFTGYKGKEVIQMKPRNEISSSCSNFTTGYKEKEATQMKPRNEIASSYSNFTEGYKEKDVTQMQARNEIASSYSNFTEGYKEKEATQMQPRNEIASSYSNFTEGYKEKDVTQMQPRNEIASSYSNFTEGYKEKEVIQMKPRNEISSSCSNFTTGYKEKEATQMQLRNEITSSYSNFTEGYKEEEATQMKPRNEIASRYSNFTEGYKEKQFSSIKKNENVIGLPYSNFIEGYKEKEMIPLKPGDEIASSYSNFTEGYKEKEVIQMKPRNEIASTYSNFPEEKSEWNRLAEEADVSEHIRQNIQDEKKTSNFSKFTEDFLIKEGLNKEKRETNVISSYSNFTEGYKEMDFTTFKKDKSMISSFSSSTTTVEAKLHNKSTDPPDNSIGTVTAAILSGYQGKMDYANEGQKDKTNESQSIQKRQLTGQTLLKNPLNDEKITIESCERTLSDFEKTIEETLSCYNHLENLIKVGKTSSSLTSTQIEQLKEQISNKLELLTPLLNNENNKERKVSISSPPEFAEYLERYSDLLVAKLEEKIGLDMK